MMGKTIVWGVCGIGNGHLFRQLPLIEHFAKHNRIAVVSSGEALRSLEKHFAQTSSVRVIEALVPFYPGTRDGVDWGAAAALPQNQGKDFVGSKNAALEAVRPFAGVPDLVVSDYEPTVAEYAYACEAPLVTIDQQSKFLTGGFPPELSGYTYKDEAERLARFFPEAKERIVCSFFSLPQQEQPPLVTFTPPLLREEIANAPKERERSPHEFLVYLSAARDFTQSLEEALHVLGSVESARFHVFAAQVAEHVPRNVTLYAHGDPDFDRVLLRASGVITTAGHTLLSEAMHIGTPVYAMPVAPYEQHLNASVIHDNGFGVSHPHLAAEALRGWISAIPQYRANIESDSHMLLRGDGREEVISILERCMV